MSPANRARANRGNEKDFRRATMSTSLGSAPAKTRQRKLRAASGPQANQWMRLVLSEGIRPGRFPSAHAGCHGENQHERSRVIVLSRFRSQEGIAIRRRVEARIARHLTCDRN